LFTRFSGKPKCWTVALLLIFMAMQSHLFRTMSFTRSRLAGTVEQSGLTEAERFGYVRQAYVEREIPTTSMPTLSGSALGAQTYFCQQSRIEIDSYLRP
jgi:hypothetical protein